MSDHAPGHGANSSEVGAEAQAQVTPPTPPQAPHGGQLLRAAREAAGLHVAALAVSLKVPVRQIEALELGQFDRLPDPTFARALAASICRQLRIDSKPILDQLPQLRGMSPHVGASLNEPFHRPGASSGIGATQVALKLPALLAVLLLLAALALLLLPPLLQDEASDASAPAASGEPAAAPAGAEGPANAASAQIPAAAGDAAGVPAAGMAGVVVESVQPLPLPPAGPSAQPAAPAGPTAPLASGRKP